MTMELAPDSRLTAHRALTRRTRDLMDAVALTDVGEAELDAVTAALTALAERLRARARTTTRPLELAEDGSVRHPGNAVIGEANPHALPLVVEPDGAGVRAEIAFRPLHEGPPGGVHGGVSAMVLDHLLGQAVAHAGFPGMTGTLTLRYRRPVPYGVPLLGTAAHTRAQGRKTWAEGRIALPDGTPLVEATGLFVTPVAWP